MRIFKYSASYFRFACFFFITEGDLKILWYALRYFYRCLKLYNNPAHNCILDEKPWMSFPVIKFLEKIINNDFRVFEYGSGGSTLFFSQRVKELVSVEHDRNWYQVVKEMLANRGCININYKLVIPTYTDHYDHALVSIPDAYISADDNSVGMSYEDYSKTILAYPDNYFDLVVVDGRCRPSCMFHSLNKVKVNGFLLLDQSERKYYLEKMESYFKESDWSKVSISGPLPYSLHFTKATFFKKK
ncbi:hypothetical protein [Methylomonas rosea]|uniref:Class I SAM-dependent methyltransferase n=1 Tax=Methylomonas rosea TaxID=2952227 RepID=A0ABT1TUM4_9GAMM|nr:hypothetical protein [Methylomonas sp. WSC-7]MCQ8118230.1 hypothetical protein [Methylomonas sp. WSC-7]